MSQTIIRLKKVSQVQREGLDRLLKRDNKIINDNNLTSYNQNADFTDFNNACQQFKDVCNQIKQFAGLEQFKGGFEQAMSFLQSNAFKNNQTQGILLFSLWQGVDKMCTYEAKKVGIGQPDWWKKCWNIEQ